MTDELDPKLRELEAKLRQLKPLEVDCRPPLGKPTRRPLSPWERAGVRAFPATNTPHPNPLPLGEGTKNESLSGGEGTWMRAGYALLATAATILVIVSLIPKQPQPVVFPPPIEPLVIAEAANPLPSPNIRQQLAELFDEMNVADLPAVAKREYPVVEIVVQTTPPRIIKPTFERVRWRVEEEMLMF